LSRNANALVWFLIQDTIFLFPADILALADDVTVPTMSTTAKQAQTRRGSSSDERLMQAAEKARADAAELPPGPGRDALLRKARQSETAAHMDDWINSPGLKPLE
jgi:hypothetical protein